MKNMNIPRIFTCFMDSNNVLTVFGEKNEKCKAYRVALGYEFLHVETILVYQDVKKIRFVV
jgi:hypothetical protein